MTLQDFQELQETKPVRLTVNKAAVIMGVNPQFLRMGLQQERFPFGAAVRMKRWAYYINPQMFSDYLNGERESEKGESWDEQITNFPK